MARPKRPSDEAYNERRRQARAAARARGERIASDQAYANRRKLERQARRLEREAESRSGAFGSRLNKISDILKEKRERTYQKDGRYRTGALREQDYDLSDRDTQAEIIMGSNIGSRIWAGTQDVWRDVSYEEREQAILDAFDASSMADVLEVLEKKFGEKLYAEDTAERYDEVATAIAGMIAEAA